MKDATEVMVASDQETGKGKTRLLADLSLLGIPAKGADGLAFDLFWCVDGQPKGFDIKKPSDFIASHGDGRLYNQIKAMQDMGCDDYGILIDGFPHGPLVGESGHEWSFGAFDDAIFSVQRAGAMIIHANEGKVAQRIAEVYKYTRRDDSGSWMWPVKITPASDFKTGPVFLDKTYRSQVGAVMQTDGYGPKISDTLLQQYGFMTSMGITEEGLDIAKRARSSVKGIGPKLIIAFERFVRA